MQRRTFVAGTASALTVGLAGCGSLGSGGDDGSDGESGDGTGENASDEVDGEPGEGTDRTGENGAGNETSPPEEPPVDATVANGSFEDGLTGWTVGKDLPEVPGGSGHVDHGVETTDRQASDGDRSVQFYVSGVADDGTIWVEQPVAFSDVDAVELDVYSRQKSFNEMAQVAFFAGEKPEDGLAEADFDRSEQTEDHEGWKTYSYDVADVEGTATLAVGINVVWETEIRRLFDHARTVTE